MTDPYKKTFEDIAKALIKQSEMIVWVAKRVLSAKDFWEFIAKFSEKPDKSEVLESLKDESR